MSKWVLPLFDDRTEAAKNQKRIFRNYSYVPSKMTYEECYIGT